MYGITTQDIKQINSKIDKQKQYLKNFNLDFLNSSNNNNNDLSMLDFTYSANLNPKKYFAEINNRINTIFLNAKEKGLKPVFVTLTAPSSYHKKDKNGKLLIDPNQTAKDLTQIWNKFTSLQIFRKMKKELGYGLVYFRVYEPHKSSVPHLHAMIFIPVHYILKVKKKYKEYFSSSSWGANKNAIDFKYTWYNSKGGAVGYIMKYITKTFINEDEKQKDGSNKIQYAVYWYIKHKVRRFLSSRTLAPLSIYRKIRYYFKDKYKDDFKVISQKIKAGVIYKAFEDTQIWYIYYNHDIGEIEDIILWSKNTDLILNKRLDDKLEHIKCTQQREYFIKQSQQHLKELRSNNTPTTDISTIDPIIVKVDGIDRFIFNKSLDKFVPIIVVPSRLNDYQLYNYFLQLDKQDLKTLNIKHYILTKNEMIKRDLLQNQQIQTLNDIF